VNFPQPRFAVLPVNLGVEVIGFGGTVSIASTRINPRNVGLRLISWSSQITMQLQPASLMQPAEESRQHLHLSLLPDFHLNVKATSLLGSRAKLQGDYAFLPIV
jgi:maintenance of morphology protein 1